MAWDRKGFLLKTYISNFLAEVKLWNRNYSFVILFLIVLALCTFVFSQPYSTAKSSLNHLEHVQQSLAAEAELYDYDIDEIDFSQEYQEVSDELKVYTMSNGYQHFLLTLSIFSPIIMGIFGCLLLGKDYKYRTLDIKYAHVGKTQVIYSKILIIFLVSIALALITFIVGLILTRVMAMFLQNHHTLSEYTTVDLFSINIYAFITPVMMSLFYGLLGFGITLWLQNAILGMFFCIAVPYVEKYTGLQTFLPQDLSLNMVSKTFEALPGSTMSVNMSNSPFSYFISTIGILIWICILFGLIGLNLKFVKAVKY